MFHRQAAWPEQEEVHVIGCVSVSRGAYGSAPPWACSLRATEHRQPGRQEKQVRSQPWCAKAMGNPMVMGALGVIASKLLRR